MKDLGDSVEVYFNESDPFEVEASGVASCYDKIILQVLIYSLAESIFDFEFWFYDRLLSLSESESSVFVLDHAWRCQSFNFKKRSFFKYENEEIEFCGSNWNEAFAAEDYPIHRNRAVQMFSIRFLV